ncbi:unnamed protein product, partial [Amoebophrya sp. A25]
MGDAGEDDEEEHGYGEEEEVGEKEQQNRSLGEMDAGAADAPSADAATTNIEALPALEERQRLTVATVDLHQDSNRLRTTRTTTRTTSSREILAPVTLFDISSDPLVLVQTGLPEEREEVAALEDGLVY